MRNTPFSERIWLFGSFLRLPLFGWTLAMPVLGVLSVASGASYRVIVPFLMTIPFHIVFAVVNDLASIEMDRTDARKAARPLVSGAVNPTAAKVLVIASIAAAFPVDTVLLGFNLMRSVTLAISFLATAAYNVAGKRTPFPAVMDALLGVGSAAFMHYTVLAIAGTPSATTWLVEAAIVIYITLDNGFHFSVRDIESDFEYGAYTTAIAFGARPRDGAPYLPRRFWVYGWCLQILLTIVTLVPVLIGVSQRQVGWSAATVAIAFAVGSYVFIYPSIDPARSSSARYVNAGLQSLCAFGSIAALAGAKHGGLSALGVVALVVVPLGAKRAIRALRLVVHAPARTQGATELSLSPEVHGQADE